MAHSNPASLDIKEVLSGILTTKVQESIFTFGDAIDQLNNENRVVLPEGATAYVRYYDVDGNVLSLTDKYGVAPSASNTAVEDRTYTSEKIDMPNVEEISITIGLNSFGAYGIRQVTDFLKPANTMSGGDINAVAFSLNNEVAKLVDKVREAERAEVSVFLDEIGASSDPFVVPFGEQLSASSGRVIWNWVNKTTTALSEPQFETDLNLIALQKNTAGYLIGGNPIHFLFHAKNSVLAKKLLNPDEVVNSNYRSIASVDLGSGVPNDVRMSGIYQTTDLNDYIIICHNHSIKRVSLFGYENYKVEIFPLLDKNQIKIAVKKCSVIACDSPVGIHKGIVA